MGKAPKSSSRAAAAATPSSAPAVSLPPRANANPDAAGRAPVWSLQAAARPETPVETDPVPLAAKCDLHNVERTVCCRELKGSDERNLISPDVVRDILIGFADGITVPFALTAGLASLDSSRIVRLAGIAELVSGAISMGVGGYLSAQAERDHFRYLRTQTRERVTRSCAGEMEREISEILSPLGIPEALSRRVAGSLLSVEATLVTRPPPPSAFRTILRTLARKPKFTDEESPLLRATVGEDDDEKGLTAFLLKFGEGLEEVSDSRIWISAITIGSAYAGGGLIPLLPYFCFESARTGLLYSIVITGIVLLIFGALKQHFTGATGGWKGYTYGAVSMLATGGLAAAASFGIVKALEGGGL